MTTILMDDMTDTRGNKKCECVGQGVANIATGFTRGIEHCTQIGQSDINVKSGGHPRFSSLVARWVLLIAVVFLWGGVKQIPMAALVAMVIGGPSARSTGSRSKTCESTPNAPAW